MIAKSWQRPYSVPHAKFEAMTKDGIAIRGVHLETGCKSVIIYCHGILAGKDYRAIPRFVELLAESADAIAFDFRGHGESEGRSTLGEREVDDLDAVVQYARESGYSYVFLVGSSMGGAVCLRYAADSSLISGVATIGSYADTRFTRLGRAALVLYGLPVAPAAVRLIRGTRVESLAPLRIPIDSVHGISPRPVLFIHGALDYLVPRAHAYALYQAAGEPKKLIIIPRGGHDIPNLNSRTRDWIYEWFSQVPNSLGAIPSGLAVSGEEGRA